MSTTAPAPVPPSTDENNASAPLLALLDEAIQEAVGPHAAARPGQRTLAANLWTAMETRGHTVEKAPTGVGKSLVALAAAATAAIRKGERTVIATGSLGLLSQYADKDAPILVQVAAARGFELRIAELKGVGNYADLGRLRTLAAHALAEDHELTTPPQAAQLAEALTSTTTTPHFAAWLSARWGAPRPEVVLRLGAWAADQYACTSRVGDRQSCPIEHTDAEWALLGGPAPTPGTKSFPSKLDAARARCAAAHIVVTNHTLLALQAAKRRPFVIGGPLGPIDHLIIDEAHTLPNEVRQRGAAEVSAASFARVAKLVSEAGTGVAGRAFKRDTDRYRADDIERALRPWAGRTLTEGQDPFHDIYAQIEIFLTSADQLLTKATDPQAAHAALLAVEELKTALEMLSAHRRGLARWVSDPQNDDGPAAHASPTTAHVTPVEIGGMLERQLYFRERVPEHAPDATQGVSRPWQRDTLLVPLSITAMSATINNTYLVETRSRAQHVTEHATPFAHTNARIGLYIPGGPAVVDEVSRPGTRGRRIFDLRAHVPFVQRTALHLIRANDGRALVLTATSRDGKALTKHLRTELRGDGIHVHSQWDDRPVPQVTATWKADERSILIGTKSLMTGLDAPGQTCSLVIVDRPPRARGNPADDARVAALIERGYDKWMADVLIYVSDAALSLEQSAGRLVRSIGDRGMVCVADPRLLGNQTISYHERARNTYMAPLRKFGRQMADMHEAIAFLRAEHAKRTRT